MNRQAGEADIGQFLRDAIEAAADGFYRQAEDKGNQGADNQYDQRAGRSAQNGKALGQTVVGEQKYKAGLLSLAMEPPGC